LIIELSPEEESFAAQRWLPAGGAILSQQAQCPQRAKRPVESEKSRPKSLADKGIGVAYGLNRRKMTPVAKIATQLAIRPG